MAKLIKSRSGKKGLPPGAAVYVGSDKGCATAIGVMDYRTDRLEECSPAVEACVSLGHGESVTWIDVVGLADVATIQALSEGFGLHPLVLEDILNTDQRPKVEEYGDYVYIVVKMLQWDARREEMVSEQVSLVMGNGYVLSFQERPGDVFDHVRQRIREGKGRLRRSGADYLLNCLLDAVVDGYFTVMEHLGDKIEDLEKVVTGNAGDRALKTIHRLKREALLMRKSIWPLRELLGALERSEMALITESTHLYLRDVYDHSVQVMDTMETFREMLSGLLDLYLSMVSNRMNEVMKVLTIIATIFIPLTFIAGIYGMNFQYMPELGYKWAYPAALALMALMALVMVVFFRRKKWL